MKKKSKTLWALYKPIPSLKIFMIMRIMVFLLILGVIHVMGKDSYSQNTKVSLNMNDVTVGQVLNTIESQSEFYFIYNPKLVDVNRKVNIHARNEKIEKVLDQLFNGTNIEHMVLDRQVVLSPKVLLASSRKAEKRLQQQQITVTGTVTDEKGDPLPGVNIIVKGTVQGTITDADGKYTLSVAPGATLVFSYVGYKTQEIPVDNQTTVNVTMAESTVGINEVVVTALGITRERKALGYAVQDISGDDIEKTAETNVINALAGKSAGVFVNSSNGNVGASSRIIIRGNNSLRGGNQPLFVVDGVPIDNSLVSSSRGGYDYTDMGNRAADINPADIAEMTILKGANAAALYGARGANGVVLITTKTGSRSGFSVELGNSTTFSNPLRLPDFQNQYGQGGGGQYWYYDGLNGGKYDGVDESFGPELDYVVKAEDIQPGGKLYWAVEAGFPQTVGEILKLPQFNSPIDPVTGERIPTPWISHPDNVKNFYETGIKRITSASLSNGGDWGAVRLSLTNSDEKGMLPNTNLIKNTVSFSGQTNLTEKLSFDIRGSYINLHGNMSGSGYTFNNVNMQTIWGARQVDWAWLKDHIETEDGRPISWINRWHNNPYWIQYKNLNPMKENRVIGKASVNYQFTDWLSLMGRIGTDASNQQVELKRAYYGINDKEGRYQVTNYTRQEINADFLLSANKKINSDLTLRGNFGGNIMNKQYREQGSYVSKLVVPNNYSLANAKETPTTKYYKSEKEIQSLYGDLSVGFKDQLFLDLTGRNDWSSTLPVDANSYFYPSATFSWIFTETFGLDPSIFSFGKIRYGWAQVGNDTDPYRLDLIYSAGNPYGTNPRYSIGNTMPPLKLKNELITSNEIGLDLRFFNNRFGIDVTVYKSKAENQILSAAISPTSGYNSQLINAGRIDNQGVEIMLHTTPVQTNDFSWDVMVNWSKNKNKVVALSGDIESLELYKTEGNRITVVAPVGGSYGDMMGTGFVYHENGKIIVGKDGKPLYSEVRKLGNIMPDWLGSINNSFSYKGLHFSFLIDAKVGGDLYSRTDQDGFVTGTLKEIPGIVGTTVGLNDRGGEIRGKLEDGGGYLVDGVFEDGTPNNVYLYLNDARWGLFRHGEANLYDATYVKLREVSLSYSLPSNVVSKINLSGINIGVFARNVAILYTPEIISFDPEVSNRNASQTSQGSTYGSPPSARNIGFRVRFTY
ncbi:MAG TPA: SusC/RagA family TonB-linked outer membrane protein [Bacteroidetes bacterium]|nr:SusC/RagA family TonB-linked outer membrane protein [Bacteroidota bacterium]